MPWTSVVSHRHAIAHKGQAIDAQSVGRALNVRYLVEGEVQRAGARTVVKARLTETSQATDVWSEDLEIVEQAPGQDRQALLVRLATQVRSAVVESEEGRVRTRPVSELSAAELAFRADAVAKRNADSPVAWAEARKLYDMALRIDSYEPSALMGQALALAATLELDPNADRDSLIAEYDKLTVRLVTAAGRDARAWNIRADALQLQRRWDAALEANARAQVLDPTRTAAIGQQAELLLFMGRFNEALVVADEALVVKPPQSTIAAYLLRSRCGASTALGHYDHAIDACEKSASLDDSWPTHMYLVAAYAHQGNAGKARVHKTILLSRKPDFSIARHKALRLSDQPAYLEQIETHLYAGLRKAGIPEK